MPVGYEVFAGDRADVTTVEEIVAKIESQYGPASRIWVLDRGMVSEENLEYLRQKGQRYIVGTPKSQLKRFEQELLSKEWQEIREGLAVRCCPSPDGKESFTLCRSTARAEKEKQIHARFEERIEARLAKLVESCEKKKKRKVGATERRVGMILGTNSRAAGLFKVEVKARADGSAVVKWKKIEEWRQWAQLSEGCYILRSNITDWEGEELWWAYIHLTEAEAAFRIQKSDLRIRPLWHQKEERVQAHIAVCFLAYVLWKTLGQMCQSAGLGHEPRKVLDEIAGIKVVDIVLPTKSGPAIRKRCIAQPTKPQAVLLQRLQLQFAAADENSRNVVPLREREMHELAPRKTPEEEELDSKLLELGQLESELAERELEITSLQAELRRFEVQYLRIVGSRYAELDEIEAQIAGNAQHRCPVRTRGRHPEDAERRSANF